MFPEVPGPRMSAFAAKLKLSVPRPPMLVAIGDLRRGRRPGNDIGFLLVIAGD